MQIVVAGFSPFCIGFPYLWPQWPEARAKGSGAGPLPFVIGAPPRRASGVGQTVAPTDRHSPFAEI